MGSLHASVPPEVIRLCSDDIPERDRVAFVREIYGRMIVKHEIEPYDGGPFQWQGLLQSLPGLGLASTVLSSVRTQRTAQQIDSDDLVLNVSVSGRRIVRQYGREVIIGPGELAVTRSSDIASCEVSDHARCLNIRVPVGELSPMICDLDPVMAMLVPADSERLSLLLSYVESVQETQALARPELAHLVVTHVHDLVALTLGATRDAAETARGRGVRAARLRAIQADIVRNIGRRDLSVEGIAARHAISARYVSMLFESEGTTFSAFVLSCRLTRAYRMLSGPRHTCLSVSAIAFACGFGDLSYFNRCFRRSYGVTPSDVRTAWRYGAGDWGDGIAGSEPMRIGPAITDRRAATARGYPMA
jgi:AraC-like DNA-binding protein